ncbi:MAG: hypothetical protein IJS39_05590 [Synergistaceae bacterium]|nr:hypothetical protein [Synergistaceae bacterium]
MLEEDKLCVVYQGQTYDAYSTGTFENFVDMENKKASSQNILDIEIMEAGRL